MPVLQDTDRKKQTLNYIIKLAVTGSLLFLIFRNVGSADTLRALAAVSPGCLFAAMLLQLASTQVVAAYKYRCSDQTLSKHFSVFYFKRIAWLASVVN